MSTIKMFMHEKHTHGGVGGGVCVSHLQCCQHLLTRNPKIYEGECIGHMGIDS